MGVDRVTADYAGMLGTIINALILQDALEKIAGTREMDASAIRDYFAPLQKWLDEQNQGKPIGW
jgi:uridylate kinase